MAFIIAEIGLAHDGSLGMAHAFVDACAALGADAVKFQTHIASAESCRDEPFRINFSYADKTRYDYWVRTGFSNEQWAGLAIHCKDAGVEFMSSPFSCEAVNLLEGIGVSKWKVASGELMNKELLKRIASADGSIILSSGLSPWSELDECVEFFKSQGKEYSVLQTTSMYPTPAERVGINVMLEMEKRYGCPVGISDHSGTIYPGLSAVALGASFVEVHVTLSRSAFGPDVKASLTLEEFGHLVEGVRFIEKMMGAKVAKDEVAEEMSGLREIFGRSAVAVRDLQAGSVVDFDMITFRKPAVGLTYQKMMGLVGQRLSRSVAKGNRISEDDFS